MPLIRPTLSQTVRRIRADIATLIPTLNPTLAASFIRGIVESVGIRINAANLLIEQAAAEAFPSTATGDNLERLADGVTRNAASGSSGTVGFFGSANTVIPIETTVQSPEGQSYQTVAAITLAQQTLSISQLSSAAGVATAIAGNHTLVSGQSLTVAGADDDEYNGTFVITVIDANTFTYPVEAGINSPTSGTITGVFTGALALVESVDQGVATNQEDGAKLTLTSPISGANDDAIVRFDGITGGTDAETDDELRARIIEVRSGIQANFSPDSIIALAKETAGVTRVSVNRATPAAGDVTVHFVRDGDDNIIPSSSDVAAVRSSLLTILPATSSEDALIVSAPTSVAVDFTFTSLSPNTDDMRTAVRASLDAFFDDQVDIGESVSIDEIRSAILQTVADDASLESFTLSTPTATVSISTDEIAQLGTVTFA